MSALSNLGRQFAPLAVEHVHRNVGAMFPEYDRKKSVGTLSGYEERYAPQKKLGLKHRPNQGLPVRTRSTGFHP